VYPPDPIRQASPEPEPGETESPPRRAGGATGRIVAWPLLGLVWLYRRVLSPFMGVNCRFEPSCSEYASEALRQYGGFRGGWLALKRLGRCHPWGGSGYDPVPKEGNGRRQ
jgi:hypothetical protein